MPTSAPRKTAAKKAPARKAPARNGNTSAGRQAVPVISIGAAPVAEIPILLVGKRYKIKPPKSALALSLGQSARNAAEDPDVLLGLMDEWCDAAFGAGGAEMIQARFRDSKDDLDFKHVMQLVEALVVYTNPDPSM